MLQASAKLVPRLRNEYFHGEYLLSDDFLPLSLRLREVADTLAAFKQRSEPLQQIP